MWQLQRGVTARGASKGTAFDRVLTPSVRSHSRAWIVYWAAALAWLAVTAWMRPLALPDEGRYVGVAWEMLRSGDWAVPTLDGLPFFHKPPLFYWITAASMSVFGPTQMAMRAASLLGAAMAVVSVVMFVRRWVGERSARRVLVVLTTMPLFFGAAQFANLDMLVAGCISATLVLAAHALLLQEQRAPWRGVLALAFACAALGTLAKGLIGGVLPLLVIVAWAIATRRVRQLRWLAWPPGLALFVAIAAPWFLLMQSRYPQFFQYFFVHQHLERFAGAGFNNAQSWWFYLPVLALTTLPWFLWAGLAARALASPWAPHRDARLLMAAWLVVVVLFFSLPQSKLVGYIFPALPPLAVLLGLAAEECLVRGARARTAWRAWSLGAAATCVGVLLIVVAHPRNSFTPLLDAVHARWSPEDRVVMLDGFAYDAPVYLQTTKAAWVVDTWSDPDIALHDNARKEFHDAALFASPAARSRLIEPAAAASVVCEAPVTWVIGKPDSPSRHPWLAALERVAGTDERSVWRWDAQRAGARTSMPCR